MHCASAVDMKSTTPLGGKKLYCSPTYLNMLYLSQSWTRLGDEGEMNKHYEKARRGEGVRKTNSMSYISASAQEPLVTGIGVKTADNGPSEISGTTEGAWCESCPGEVERKKKSPGRCPGARAGDALRRPRLDRSPLSGGDLGQIAAGEQEIGSCGYEPPLPHCRRLGGLAVALPCAGIR